MTVPAFDGMNYGY
jgi:hypothetical protein